MPVPDTRLRVPKRLASGTPYQAFDSENNRELTEAIDNTRRRLRETMGKIVTGKYKLPPDTMDALYKLNIQLATLNRELKETDVFDQFERTKGPDGYLKKMDTVEKLGEILNESMTLEDGSGKTTVYGLMSKEEAEQAKKDIEVIQSNLFVEGIDLLDADAYKSYAKQYGIKRDAGKLDVVKTAAEWIEQFKDEPFTGAVEAGNTKIDFKTPARIVAARQLSNAVRRKKESLNEPISDQALQNRAAELENDATFQRIMSADEAVRTTQDCCRSSRSNGGSLEDILTRGIRRQLPGQMPNKPIHARYLPTVKERIEILKAMAKKGDDQMKMRCAAEIVALRDTPGVVRGDKNSLNIPIPTDEYGSLRARVEVLAADPVFRESMKDPEMRAALTHGHGGKLVDLLPKKREEAGKRLDKMRAIRENTYEGQIRKVQADAKALAAKVQPEKLANMPQEDKNALLADSKFMIAKYITLDSSCRDPQNRSVLDPERMKQQTGGIIKVDSDALSTTYTQSFKDMMAPMSDEDVFGLISDMSKMGQQEFMEKLAQKSVAPKQEQHENLNKEPVKQEHLENGTGMKLPV